MAECLDDIVRRDYSSLAGAQPDEVAGPALAAEWRGMLEGLTGHQHCWARPSSTRTATRPAPPCT